MFFPDLRATFTGWRSCSIFEDDPACGSFSEPPAFVDALDSSLSFESVEDDDDWLTCSSLVGDGGSVAHSGVVTLDASMLS